jgi:hypothetical protein
MSSVSELTTKQPWFAQAHGGFFMPTGPCQTYYAPPTGNPIDLVHTNFASTPLAQALPPVASGPTPSAPTVTFVSFVWTGTKGSSNAIPTWTWSLSTGINAPTSLAVTVYSDASNPPTTLLVTPTLSATAITYAYTGTTIANNYYKISVTAQNALGSSTPMIYTGYNQVPATGGTITDFGGYRTHTFTSNGTFTTNAPLTVTSLVVGGGGNGGPSGGGDGGGGGAGAVLLTTSSLSSAAFSVVVAKTAGLSQSGFSSSFNGITAVGGGIGGSYPSSYDGGAGGCGGGASSNPYVSWTGGAGSVGYNGGNCPMALGFYFCGAGGGGMGSAGADTNPSSGNGAAGGSGQTYTIGGVSYLLAAGGGGGAFNNLWTPGTGGSGIGGNGGIGTGAYGTSGTPNTGSGAGGQTGGGGNVGTPPTGASGVVRIAYPFTP